MKSTEKTKTMKVAYWILYTAGTALMSLSIIYLLDYHIFKTGNCELILLIGLIFGVIGLLTTGIIFARYPELLATVKYNLLSFAKCFRNSKED